MNILVIGSGYVGLVSGICLADFGHQVTLYDKNTNKINDLVQGNIPIYEPHLKDLLVKNKDNLTFISKLNDLTTIDLIMLCVGTPSDEDGKADLSYLFLAAKEIAAFLGCEYKILVIKSTVPVGTNEKIRSYIKDLNPTANFDIVSNPEFLREGSAIFDFMNPDRIVIGIDNNKSKDMILALYKNLIDKNFQIIFTNLESSELIKYASNSFLAAKVAFINEISILSEKVGANIEEIAIGMGLDKRIGKDFLKAGPGFGGSCFPKDLRALSYEAKDLGLNLTIIDSISKSNELHKLQMAKKIISHIGNVDGKTISIFGLAFKQNTDDMRESASIIILSELQKNGAKIKAYDPEAMENAKLLLENIEYYNDPYKASLGSHAVIIITEWDEFKILDYNKIAQTMESKILIDLRNILDKDKIETTGIKYFGIGKN